MAMITRFLNKHAAPLYRALRICSGFLCFVVLGGGLGVLADLHLQPAPLALGLSIVIGLTFQSMIFFLLVNLAAEIFVKRKSQFAHETD